MAFENKREIINNRLPIDKRENQIGVNNQGLEMKITRYSKLEYQKESTIDVEFLIDGYKAENKTYRNFLLGTIKNPNFPDTQFINRIGERRQNTNGDWMEIIGCFNTKNCIVRFDDDGSIVEGVRYSHFNDGKVAHPWRFTDSLLYKHPKIAEAIAIPENKLTLDDCAKIPCNRNESYFVKCFDCNKVSSKKKMLSNLTRYGIACEYCSDGISIPNKMLRQFDNQLDLGWEFEYSPEWLKINGKQHSFDAYDDKLKIVIEADAVYKDNHKGKRKEVDNWKDKIANEHGIEVIRINLMDKKEYDSNKFEYIKQQTYKILGNLYDLDKVDWELAWKSSQKSKCIEAWELWNSEIYSTTEIGEILKLNEQTIRRYLKRGYKLGLCDYTKEKSFKKRGLKNKGENNYKVILYWVVMKNGEKYFDSPLYGNQIYSNKGLLKVGFKSFKKYVLPYGGIYIEDIKKITKDKRIINKLAPFDGWKIIKVEKEGDNKCS